MHFWTLDLQLSPHFTLGRNGPKLSNPPFLTDTFNFTNVRKIFDSNFEFENLSVAQLATVFHRLEAAACIWVITLF